MTETTPYIAGLVLLVAALIQPDLAHFSQVDLLPPEVENETMHLTAGNVSGMHPPPIYEAKWVANAESVANDLRRNAVREEFAWSWSAYERYAWGRDELMPLTLTGRDWVDGHSIGLTLIDSLDSLILMGFDAELRKAHAWVTDSLSFDVDGNISTFEVTIRALGGLLSAHALTAQQPATQAIFLQRAIELGERLLPAFDTLSGLPTTKINLRKGAVHTSLEPLVLSEVGTLQLEFAQLSKVTGDRRYKDAVDAVASRLAELARESVPYAQLLPILLHAKGATVHPYGMVSLGAGGDSYYEYLLKAWLQSGSSNTTLRRRYASSAQAISKRLIARTPRGQVYAAELYGFPPANDELRHKMDHLACFVPGMLALGAATGAISSKRIAPTRRLASELLDTCWSFYESQPTGLAPEIVELVEEESARGAAGVTAEFDSAPRDRHSLLRPETAESLFIMWRLTHDQKWRDRGWAMLLAFRAHARLPSGGYAPIESVAEVPVRHRDGPMESFWLGETLKYLYLLFCDDDVLPLKDWVFNTEAHPLPIDGRHSSR